MPIVTKEKDPGIFQTFTLKNGITIYFRQYDQTFGLPKVACCVLINAGGRDDEAGKEGAAHFFEHMPFRGTKNFPNVRALTQEIENNGGYVNAFTSDEATGYEVTIPTTMLEDGIKRIADMLNNPLLRHEDIETERNIILEELRNRLSQVNFFARQELYKGLLGDHPIVTAVLGTEESLNNLARTDLINFHRHHYNAQNINLFFVGDSNPKDLVKICERYFYDIPSGMATERNLSLIKPNITAYQNILEPKKYNRSVYMLGRVLPPTNHNESLKLQLFRGMLSWGLYSPLYQEIREKRGLAYNLSVSHHEYKDVGLLVFSVSTQFKQMDEVDKVIWQIVESILEDKERFNEVKHTLKQSLLYRDYSLESVLHEGMDDYLDYGRIISLDEAIEALDKITLGDLKDFVEPLLKKDEFLNIRVNADVS